MNTQIVYSVSDFVAVCNQVLDISFGLVEIVGELSQFKVSKNRWVYFDLKDEHATLRFFGTVYQLPGPLEDGMLLVVRGIPQLHPKFGFSVTVQSIQLSGEGTIKKSVQLLEEKLTREGLFGVERKRHLPYPPTSVGLITSAESAAYADFIKVLGQRWGGVDIQLFDVQVQGERAISQITEAIAYFNTHAQPDSVIVITRGGGSAEDLQAFNSEQVTRAVAASRIPTLVAIGHEVDVSLAEMAADVRASTPSNAAELLAPDKKHEYKTIAESKATSLQYILRQLVDERSRLAHLGDSFGRSVNHLSETEFTRVRDLKSRAELLNPQNVLKRGYAIVRQNGMIIQHISSAKIGETATLQFSDGIVKAQLTDREVI